MNSKRIKRTKPKFLIFLILKAEQNLLLTINKKRKIAIKYFSFIKTHHLDFYYKISNLKEI